MKLKLSSKAKTTYFSPVWRRDSEYVGRRMMMLELPGRRPRGRTKRRLVGVEKVGVKDTGLDGER